MLFITASGFASAGRIMMADAMYNNIGRAGRVAALVVLRLVWLRRDGLIPLSDWNVRRTRRSSVVG